MVRAEATFAWHLKRGEKIYSPVSHRELRLLAELGHLRSDDSLWRPGLSSWTPASSLPGIPPLMLCDDSQPKQWDLTGIGRLFWTRMIALFLARLSTRQQILTVKGWLKGAYHRATALRPSLDLIEAARRRPHNSILAVLLVIAVLVAAVDLHMKSSFATGSNAQIPKSIVSKFQDRPSTERGTPTPLWTNAADLKTAIDLTEAEVFNVSNGHPTGGHVLASNQTSEAETESVAQTSRLVPASQSETAAEIEAVPLPTKKPERSSVEEAKPKTVTSKRVVQRPRAREPKSMRFGIIGYNYNPQQ